MRKKLLILFLGITMISFSQIPSYYNDVNLNLSGTALKDELATKIINTHHTNLSYTPGVWDALKQTDLVPNDNTRVFLIYGYDDNDGNYVTDRTRDKDANGGTAGTQWNREHVYAKSLGNPNLGTTGPGADAHHLRAADITFNSDRGSLKFATGSGNAGPSNGGWYPGDEWKGDVARMMMYMYLRYGNQCLPTGVGIGSTTASDPNMISLFLQWNTEDPVSAYETQRNPILESMQGNRNPFIDNPAFATQIWGGPQAEDKFGNPGGGDTEAPTVPLSLAASNTTQSSTDLSWLAATDNVGVTAYEIYQDATYIGSTSLLSYSVSGLTADTSYTFTVRARDAAGNTSADSNQASVTTLAGATGGGTTTELLISEYVEGSSNNKAIELANFTGSSIDLSQYSLKRNTNGGSSWGAAYALSGNLASGNTYVIANSSASSSVTSLADITTGSDALLFNGNDPVGLFKNNVLIDIVGTFSGGSADFAKDVTLRRKTSVTSPTTGYNTGEWDSFSVDTFSGLGTHSIDGGSTPDTEAPSTPTGLAASNILETSLTLNWNAATDNVAVIAYEVFQDGISIGTVSATSFNVTGLAAATSYNFTVTASDAAGNTSPASSVLTVSTIDTTAPSAPSNLSASNTTETTVDLSWNASSDNVSVTAYDIYQDATYIGSTSLLSYSVSGLTADTSYTFTVRARDAAGNTSADSNQASVTTLAGATGGGTTTELLISEYVEGSSNNKAIELANFTGSSIDLSQYSLKRNTNGGSSWGAAYALSGNLASGSTYVIANSSASSSVTSLADITTGSDALLFNGNDPVGLFKNNVLIDIVGMFSGGSADFAKDVTLRRKTSVTSPTTSYNTGEWDSFSVDTFSGLGTHSIDGAPSSVVLHEAFFESGWDGWIDGGGDCYRYSGSRSYEGSYSIRLRDNSGTGSAMTSPAFDISGYDTVTVEFYFNAYSMETNEDFFVRYYDGSSWTTVETYVSGIDFNNDSFYTATVTIDAASYLMASNAQFRFQCDASSNADHVYIDQVRITGNSTSSSAKRTTGNSIRFVKSHPADELPFALYPNPVKEGVAYIRAQQDVASVPYKVYNTIGQLVLEGKTIGAAVQLPGLDQGLYMLELHIEDERIIHKLIIE